MRNPALLAILLVQTLVFVAYGGSDTPPIFPLRSAAPATMIEPPVQSCWLGEFVINLGSTELKDILEAIKAGKIQHKGDASESIDWICYSIPTQSSPVRLWLLSGETDAASVGTVVARQIDEKDKILQTCPELPSIYRPTKLDRGIWISTSREDVLKILGTPSFKSDNWLRYESKQSLIDPQGFSEFGSLSLRFKDGRVVELWATKTEND